MKSCFVSPELCIFSIDTVDIVTLSLSDQNPGEGLTLDFEQFT